MNILFNRVANEIAVAENVKDFIIARKTKRTNKCRKRNLTGTVNPSISNIF